jgi:hypothetical protein
MFLKHLPIIKPSFVTPIEHRRRSADSLLLFYKNAQYERMVRETQNLLGIRQEYSGKVSNTLPDRSDVLHDVLANLAEVMMELNKRLQKETCKFLGAFFELATPFPKVQTALLEEFKQNVFAKYSRLGSRNPEDHLKPEKLLDVLRGRPEVTKGLNMASPSEIRSEYDHSTPASVFSERSARARRRAAYSLTLTSSSPLRPTTPTSASGDWFSR